MKTASHFVLFALLLSGASFATPRLSKFSLLLASAAGPSGGGCSRDTDCKGDRICVQSVCEEPSSAPRYSAPPSAVDHVHSSELDQTKALRLDMQMQQLEQSKPGLGGAITLTILGGVIFLPGFIVFLVVDLAIGATLMLIAAIPLGIGIGLWAVNAGRADAIDHQIQALKEERSRLNVSQSSLDPRAPMFTLARF